jgi:Brp/Blh family beta-carotene 15,15'-monooxygenase
VVLVLLSYLAPKRDAQLVIQVLAGFAPLCGFCLAITVIWSGIRYYRNRSRLDLARLVELSAVGLTFAFLPALLAFTIYFNLLHSVRHMLEVVAGQIEREAKRVWSGLTWTTLPVTAVTFLLGGAAYLLLTGPAFDMEQLFRVIFIGIASMTYPHMAVVWLAKRARIIS